MPVEIIDQKKKNQVETLLIVKRCRAKGVDDDKFARIYEPGEEIRIAGSGKLSLLALKYATRDLDAEPMEESKTQREKSKDSREKVETEKTAPAPKLANMKLAELDEYAEVSLGIDTKSFRTKPEKIAAIKAALKK